VGTSYERERRNEGQQNRQGRGRRKPRLNKSAEIASSVTSGALGQQKKIVAQTNLYNDPEDS